MKNEINLILKYIVLKENLQWFKNITNNFDIKLIKKLKGEDYDKWVSQHLKLYQVTIEEFKLVLNEISETSTTDLAFNL